MARSLDTDTAAALVAPTLYITWFIRLDIANDPVYINSSMTPIYFGAGLGYDAALVGYTFLGVGNIGTIDPITDSTDGSEAMTLTLPGVDMSQDYLHQLVTNGDLWQRKQGWVWFTLMTAAGVMIGKPVRVKSARIDQLTITIDPTQGTGTLVVSLESQQAYSGDALQSRYSEQQDIDSTDTSNIYTADLANKVPGVGNTQTNASSQSVGAKLNTTAAQTLYNVKR